ncbi:unnamed protein product [Taenia asiatica]|uniref:UBA domain-containing protein n=1 Tax=Taenia asiatica TaxID=60517 RepID=A0A0R3WEX5_TAEAS|nr:unnamed protein product [Taenia asiatica]
MFPVLRQIQWLPMCHLEGVGLSIRIVPCINSVRRCNSTILLVERACAAALSLAQLNKEVIASLRHRRAASAQDQSHCDGGGSGGDRVSVRLDEWLTLQEADRVAFEAEVFRGRYALALPSFVESAVDAVGHSGSATAAVEFFGLRTSKLDQALCSGVYSFPAVELGNIKGEEVVPEKPGETSGQQSQQSRMAADKTVVEQLQSMGFTCDACPAAASGTEAASRWLMEHLDNCDFNAPIPGVTTSPLTASSVTVEMGSLAALSEMDITADLAKRAVEARDNKVEAVINMVFSNPNALLALPSRCNKAVPHQ